jgi:transposase-like protein
MGRKPKFSKESKLLVVKKYNEGQLSYEQIINELRCGRATLNRWIKQFNVFGEKAFDEKPSNKGYSKELKLAAIEDYLSGQGSLMDISLKYGLTNDGILSNWVMKYNSHKEIKDYDPKGDVYMTKSRPTNYDEKLEIVNYCIEKSRNYKLTAEYFNQPYSQVYQWVRKFDEQGKTGLLDGRGRRKEEANLSDIDKLKRDLEAKERENNRLRMENDVLKKFQEIGRGERLTKSVKK